MFEIIAIIAVVPAIAIAIVLILAATKPNTLRVQRAISIKAPADRIFPLINDFHQWRSWSPYEDRDPALKRAGLVTARMRTIAIAIASTTAMMAMISNMANSYL